MHIDSEVFVIFRLFFISVWLVASLGASVERAYAHVLNTESTTTAGTTCTAKTSGDSSNHCANACVAGMEAALQAAAVFPTPDEPQDAAVMPHAPVLTPVATVELPPSRAGPMASAGMQTHLDLLATTRLLI